MSTLAKAEVLAATRRVYSQNSEATSLLARHSPSLETASLPRPFPADDANPSVVIGDSPSVFNPELQEAIEQNRARLIYILPQESALPPEASGTPVFNFLVPPLQPAVLASTVNAAFDNLALSRRQAILEEELARARSEIDELNQIGIALSTQRDTQ